MSDEGQHTIRAESYGDPTQTEESLQTQSDGGTASNPLQQKYAEYRSSLNSNPQDFQTWTYLLSTVERMDEIEKIVDVFSEFLNEYPLCYGYWKKYADAALKHRGVDAATEIYERGVVAVPYSVDLWGHYLTFRMTNTADGPEALRTLFERGLAFVGTDYLCHSLWDKYFQLETEQENYRNLAQLYGRVLSVPFKELEAYHGKFEKFASEHPISEMLSHEQIEAYKNLMLNKKEAKRNEDRDAPDVEFRSRQSSAIDADVQMHENGTPKQTNEASVDAMDTDAGNLFGDDGAKQFWMQTMADVYAVTHEELNVRKQYEDCIKRPYFHVKALDNVQLQAWWKYLDYQLGRDNHVQTVILFERCVVACASYPEFWMRYVVYLEPIAASEAVNVLKRSTHVFCKSKTEMHLFAAHFYERQGDLQSCRHSLQHITSTLAPSYLAGIVQHASFEYRHGDPEAGNQIYETKIATELEKETSDIAGYLAIQYAHIQLQHFKAKDKAREIMERALQGRRDLMGIWEGAIQMEELISDENSVGLTKDLYRKCTMSEGEEEHALDIEDRYTMTERFLTFLDLHGTTEEYGKVHRFFLEQFGLRRVAPSLHPKRTEGSPSDVAATKPTQGDSTASVGADAAALQASASTAMADYFAQNPTAQQYAQYYQYAAAAAAAGYNAYTGGYNASYTG